ncbi:MAG: MFS transporter [Gaiellales bacterium]
MRRVLHPLRSVLANPALVRLQLSWAGSMLGSCAYVIALFVVAFHSGGATAVGLILVVKTATAAIASPIMGGLADRHSRRSLMALSDSVRAALTVVMALLVHTGAPIVTVYLMVVAVSVVGAVFRPAQGALVPALATSPEELTASNALSGTIESVGIFAGPGIGGLVMAVAGTDAVFILCGIAYGFSAVFALSIDEPARVQADHVPDDREGKAGVSGLSLFTSAPTLVAVTLTYAAQALAAGALGVFMVALAIDELGLGSPGVGYLDAVFGVGGVVGGAIITAMSGTRRLAAAFGIGVAGWGIGVALCGVTTSTVVVFALMAGVGAVNTVVDVAAVTLIQRSAPDAVLGQVFGILESLMLASLGAGALLAPLAIRGMGLRGSLVVTGLVLPVVVGLAQRQLVKLDRLDPDLAHRVELLRGNRVFAPLAEATLEQLSRQLEAVQAAAGCEVIHQGDHGDRVYLVETGRLEVDVDGQAGADLEAGDVFGEIALLEDVPRTATVRAVTECRLFTLGRDEFLAAVTGHPRSAAEAAVVVSSRLGALRPGVVTT